MVSRLFARISIGWLLLGGLLLRIAIAPWFRGSKYDLETMRQWTATLLDDPLSRFYDHAEAADHLPGDLWFLWGIGKLFRAFGGDNLNGAAFLVLLKGIPAVADVVIGFMLYTIVKTYLGEDLAKLTAALFLFNPASLYLTSVWGQWDAVSTAMMLVTLRLFLKRGDAWLAGIPVLAWALMIKPQLVLVIPFLLLVPLRRELTGTGSWIAAGRFLAPRVFVAAAGAIGTVSLAGLPFGVGLPGFSSRWPLRDRLDYALNIWPYKTMGASNVWMIPIGSLHRESDLAARFLGIDAHTWGNIVFGVAYIAILAAVWRRWNDATPEISLVWGLVTVFFAFFMIPTRVHERYLFPGFVAAILLAGLNRFDRRCLAFAAGLSATFLFNLIAVYWRRQFAGMLTPIAVTNCVLFAAAIVLEKTVLPGDQSRRKISGSTTTSVSPSS
jgi:Gpi18-like mannosyltransferase